MPTFEHIYTPVADSLVLSTLVSAIPIVVLFALLAGFRVAAHWSSLASLASLALIIAVAVYGMPGGAEDVRLGGALPAALTKGYERLPETVAGLHFVAFACLFLHRVVLSSGLAPRQSCSTAPLMQTYRKV
ncbi:MAG: hypothetical protein AVDCRST_MAG28-2151 [uncultured Rubrobacteraceae bacterium]|uniref:L-lactate permease n=1 Tax=uncultured Rubrobacteraceae bacterium TaxID=349277 RepID=A0A6J4QTD7_9ACTN|nr:MAG: hypothetical protein AVDCRST_MAG28-2151 [uncultured Rubrobacteraceae bacterium]